MFELSACVALLFAEEERPLADRVRAAAAAGCAGVDLWGWRDLDLGALATTLDDCEMSVRMMLVEPTSHLVDASRLPDFLTAVEESVAAAARIRCEALVVLPGERLAGVSEADQDAAIVEGLRAAAPICAEAGLRLLLEPLNTRRDHPGVHLSSTSRALDLAERVDRPEVGILYDIYHSATMGEEPVEVLGTRAGLVAHVHVADTDGRHEPGTGTIDWPRTLRRLNAIDYHGFLGLEYVPTMPSAESMQTLRATLDELSAR